MQTWTDRFSHRFVLGLVLLAPFINFIQFNDYSLWRQETLTIACWLIIIGAALSWAYSPTSTLRKTIILTLTVTFALSFFPAWQNLGIIIVTFFVVLLLAMLFSVHIEKIITIISIVFITSLFLLPTPHREAKPVEWQKPIKVVNSHLPPILYLILDEHIGIESIPSDIASGQKVKQSLQNFYLSNGFHLFGNAYSHYHETYNSIPNLLNFTFKDKDNAYFDTDDIRHLQKNKFFELIAQKGYRLKIYEPGDYLDYCEQSNVPIVSCYKFSTQSMGMLQYSPMPYSQRFLFLLKGFLLQSLLYQKVIIILNVKNWQWYDAHVSALSMLSTFSELKNDLAQPKNGIMYFAHIFAPHSPYMYDANCQLLSLDHWRIGSIPIYGAKNTPASRAETYINYNQQTLCVEKQVQAIFTVMQKAKIYDKAIIIVQGDHGSRIALHEPYIENKSVFTPQDFRDYYPTLFVIKAPGYTAAYDKKVIDIQTLLAGVTEVITGNKIVVPQEAPFFYLTVGDTVGLPMEKVYLTNRASK